MTREGSPDGESGHMIEYRVTHGEGETVYITKHSIVNADCFEWGGGHMVMGGGAMLKSMREELTRSSGTKGMEKRPPPFRGCTKEKG